MNRLRTPGFGIASLFASCVAGVCAVASAQSAGSGQKTYADLPGVGKPVKAGYIITTEGGVEGRQSVYYAEGESHKGPGKKLDPNDRTGLGPDRHVATNDHPGMVNAGGRFKNDEAPVDMSAGTESAVGSLTGKEENLSERRFGRDSAAAFGRDERFDASGRPDFGRWGREGERRDTERSEYVGMGDKYDTSARPEFGAWGAGGDRFDREDYAGGSDRAAVRNWNELFSRDKNAKFSDRDISSPLRENVNETLRRVRAYEQVSMQAINRTAFHRNRSDDAGDIPVAPAGKGEERVKAK